ncbi:LSU ribosomal protein L15P [Psychroflexus salarius]|uniref:Large ribosomal subunit protein uL15 n=1 Tax=Psychroflexus salarius TaxID=1155689 RepID=A0A1M4U927_9FLAO|nr:50S ribosomal protein L15 [Psychroflexus salarius]SHE53080.1 LSU ribosomal protein L15P [Psychroflexus salarius]
MELHNLKPAKGSVKSNSTRKGRGEASGNGGTAGRGHKGAKSRSGYSRKIGFEGGQMPLQRRLPKFGFTNPNRVEYQTVNISKLQELVDNNKIDKTITVEELIALGVVNKNNPVKILADGELKAKLEVKANKFSKSAEKAILAAGGKIEII